MDCPVFFGFRCRQIIYRIAQKVENTSQAFLTYRYLDGTAGIQGFGSADQSVGGIHGNAADRVVTGLLGNLCYQPGAVVVNFNGVEKGGQFIMGEPDIKNRADDLHNLANMFFSHYLISFSESFRTADDLRDLLGDAGLSGSVIIKIQFIDHILRIAGSGFHGGTAGSQLAGNAFADTAVNEPCQILRNDGVKDLHLVWFIPDQIPDLLLIRRLPVIGKIRERKHGKDLRHLGKHGNKAGKAELNVAEFPVFEGRAEDS